MYMNGPFIEGANLNSQGMFIGVRDASNNHDLFKNKVKIMDGSTVSSAVPDVYNIYVLGRNNKGVLATPTDNQLSMFFMGAEFTQTNVNNDTDNFETYMDAYGKGVIT